MAEETKNNVFEKLTHQQKGLIEQVSDGYYGGTAIKAVRDTTSRYSVKPKTTPSAKLSSGSGKGGK